MEATRTQLLTPQLLEQLERLSLLTRRPMRGWATGERRSRRPGHSVEFLDYRAYGIGDDLRYVDWNIFARTDRMHVKLFIDDEDLCLHLLVDASASMNWGAPAKLHWAAQLAAALGFIGLTSHERVGVAVLRERVADGWPPVRGRGQITHLLDFLAKLEGVGTTNLNQALAGYAERARGPGLVVLISDLLDPAGYDTGLRALLERRFDVHVIHVLSPDEMEPALDGDVRLIDHETGEALELSVDRAALGDYKQRLQQFLDRAETFCKKHEVGYHRSTTGVPIHAVCGMLRGRLLE